MKSDPLLTTLKREHCVLSSLLLKQYFQRSIVEKPTCDLSSTTAARNLIHREKQRIPFHFPPRQRDRLGRNSRHAMELEMAYKPLHVPLLQPLRPPNVNAHVDYRKSKLFMFFFCE